MIMDEVHYIKAERISQDTDHSSQSIFIPDLSVRSYPPVTSSCILGST